MAVGAVYYIAVAAESHSATDTLMEIASASTAVTSLERIHIGNATQDTSENLSTKTQRVTTTGTGSAFTPRKASNLSSAFGGTVKTNLTSPPTYTASTELMVCGFNVLSGFLWTPASDDEAITIPPSGLIGININTAPTAAISFTYGATIREIG